MDRRKKLGKLPEIDLHCLASNEGLEEMELGRTWRLLCGLHGLTKDQQMWGRLHHTQRSMSSAQRKMMPRKDSQDWKHRLGKYGHTGNKGKWTASLDPR